MTETKFEVGKRYPMQREGEFGIVTEITPDGHIVVIHSDDSSPYLHESDGRLCGSVSEFNLLPAIEPEGEVAGMHSKVRQALVAMADLWGAFCGDIQAGLVDPCGGGWFQLDGARIVCGYESREAALTECRQIIESIDSLLEGRAG